jgi:hypothetical protein
LNHPSDVILPSLQVNGSSDVEVSQTDERNEDGEVELEQVPEPDDVIWVQTQFADFQ